MKLVWPTVVTYVMKREESGKPLSFLCTQFLIMENQMLSFKYLNKITGISLEKLSQALDKVIGIDVEAVFSFIDDDLHTHLVSDKSSSCPDIATGLKKIAKCCLIKQVNVRIDNEVNICCISNGESFTAIFTSPAIESTTVGQERLIMQMERLTNKKALALADALTQECYLSNGVYYIDYAKSA